MLLPARVRGDRQHVVKIKRQQASSIHTHHYRQEMAPLNRRLMQHQQPAVFTALLARTLVICAVLPDKIHHMRTE